MKYLIVGGVAGGATAAARIRRNTEKDEIILFEKGDHISYANCGLPYYVGGVIADRDRLFVQTPEAFGRRFRIAVPFSLLMSGFFLLVSHINYMDPQITHVMPVLSSPLLSVHVSVIMMSFALLSLTFAVGLTALLLRLVRGKGAPGLAEQEESLALLSRLMLYPALALLAAGVFVGAVWANVSWGTYWSWDAKETWGLITLMVYAVAVHDRSLPFLRRPAGYHLFMTLAFLTILMTYFGVNYFLGGMHSYA